MPAPRHRRCWQTAWVPALLLFSLVAKADPAFDPLTDAAALDGAAVGSGTTSADLSLGLLASSGNTSNSSLTARGSLQHRPPGRDNRLDALFVDARSRGERSDRKISLADKLKLDIADPYYAFGLARYDHDARGAVRTRVSLATGLGWHALKAQGASSDTLDLDAGVGWSHGRDQDEDDFEGRSIGVAGALYSHAFNAQSSFRQSLHSEFSSQDLFVASVSTLRLKLARQWFVSLDYEWRHNRRAPAGIEHSDQIRSANIGYSFGHAPQNQSAEPMLSQPPGDAPVK